MDWLSLLAIAVALAMDAFAVAVVTGITLECMKKRQVLRMALSFGGFQAMMPALGWLAGRAVHEYISSVDHWVAFGLLAFVGGRMIWGVLAGTEERSCACDPTRGWELLMLSVATSIDALAVGLSLAMIGADIAIPALVIGVVAAVLTAAGMLLGRRIGCLWGKRVEVLGGLILIGIGVKIVAEHTLL